MKPIEIWDVYFVVPRPFVLSSFQVEKKSCLMILLSFLQAFLDIIEKDLFQSHMRR